MQRLFKNTSAQSSSDLVGSSQEAQEDQGLFFIIFNIISIGVIKINYIDFRFMFVQVFFIIPCVDIYEKIDMRTATYEIPPQEVRMMMTIMTMMMTMMTTMRRRRMITITAKKS